MLNMINVDCNNLCKAGEAPTEQIVDIIIRNIERYVKRKHPDKTMIDERQYWQKRFNSDDMIFTIIRSYR